MKKYLTTTICAFALVLSTSVFAEDTIDETMPPPPPAEQIAKHHKGDMQKELADKLNLTVEQREQAKKIHEEGRKKMKPLMEEAKKLHKKMDNLRQENMAEFEKILTDDQKKEMEKIKEDFRKKFHHKKPHHKMMKGNHELPKPEEK